MSTILEIGVYQALVSDEPENGFFRGEFLGLNGGAEFYAPTREALRTEGRISLRVFLDMCAEDGVEPSRGFSGKIELQISPEMHERLHVLARGSGKNLQEWIQLILEQAADEELKVFG